MPDREAVVLDTHAWIWLVNGNQDLARPAIQRVESAVAGAGVYIAAISIWEVAMLVERDRIRLSLPVRNWVEQALSPEGFNLAEFTPEIAIDAAELRNAHGDPADRFIMATARTLKATLVTRDERMLSYAKLGHLKAINC